MELKHRRSSTRPWYERKVAMVHLVDFGFDPAEGRLHFELRQSRAGAALFEIREGQATEKARLDRERWELIQDAARAQLNARLSKYGCPTGRWYPRRPTRLERSYGKEMLCLMWAAEPPLPMDLIPQAVRGWSGLDPEERWYLTTMSDATSDQPGFGAARGWRLAIKVALADWTVPADLLNRPS